MRRDFKESRSPARRSSKGGTILGIFIGLVVGILISLAVVWYMNRIPAPFVDRAQGPDPAQGNKNGGGSATPVPLPGKPGDPPTEKRFQFYDILPGKTDPKPDASPTDKSAPPAAGKTSGPLSLQVGSFQNGKDADNLKGTLALMGLEPKVQEVKISDKTWYRVRLGPYAGFEEMNKAKADLAKQGIQAAVVKPNE